MTLSDKLLINKIIWIRSLDNNEIGPSLRMVEDLEQRAANGGFAFEELVVDDRKSLCIVLNDLAIQAESGIRPILHFDCHGSRDEGLYLKPSGEDFSWEELVIALRKINILTENNLCCVFGVCFGLRLSMSLELSKPTPYYLTIAPEKEVLVGTLEAKNTKFYDAVYQSGNITDAFDKVWKPELKLFHCKEIFARALALHIADHCSGKGSRKRREKMVTAVLNKNGISKPSPEQLADARKKVKKFLEPTQALIDHYAPKFLIGREPGFGFTELKRLSNGYVDRNRRRAEKAMKTKA